jgi:hypothetical protein
LEDEILRWHLIGFVFIVILGFLFHFTFQLFGYNKLVGAFSAVNESVWEHLKLVYFPLMIFSVIEYFYIKDKANNIVIGKAVAAYIMPITIIVIFYSYEFITGSNSFIVDISSFFISIIVGQLLSYKILTMEEMPSIISIISGIAIIVLAVLFVIFTFYPPHLDLFRDGVTGSYGIVEHGH